MGLGDLLVTNTTSCTNPLAATMTMEGLGVPRVVRSVPRQSASAILDMRVMTARKKCRLVNRCHAMTISSMSRNVNVNAPNHGPGKRAQSVPQDRAQMSGWNQIQDTTAHASVRRTGVENMGQLTRKPVNARALEHGRVISATFVKHSTASIWASGAKRTASVSAFLHGCPKITALHVHSSRARTAVN